MKLHTLCRSAVACGLFALSLSVSASATPINESGLTARRGVRSMQGSSVAHMVAETIQIRAISMTAPSESLAGNAAAQEFVDVALDRLLTAGREDSFASASPLSEAKVPAFAAAPKDHFPSPDALFAPGTSTISVAGAKKLQPWKLVPEESERFLQVALGMVAIGFVPATLRRPR